MSSVSHRQQVRHTQAQTQAQALQLSPQLVQAIGLLNLRQDELEAFLEDKALDNPFLRIRRPRPTGPGFCATEVIEQTHAVRDSLLDSLCRQIRGMHLPADTEARAIALAHQVDENGYLTGHDTTAETCPALTALQACEPFGVGARDLVECLTLQLQATGDASPAWSGLIRNLDALAEKRTDRLLRACGVDETELAEMIGRLRALDPKPGRNFDPAPVRTRTPDADVSRGADGAWVIVLAADDAIRVEISQDYADAVHEQANCEADRAYVQRQIDDANWLTASLRRRSETLLKVISTVCQMQDEALVDGFDKLRPLSLNTVAERIGVHESTVSRCVAGKSVSTPRGLVALRDFFAEEIETSSDRAITHHEVEAEISRLIDMESATDPLSDEAMRTCLDRQGIHIARRTVTKYRERLGYSASRVRKRAGEFAVRIGA